MQVELSELRVPIDSASDIVTARQRGRSCAMRMGFSASEATLIATAISELVRNIVSYAGRGEILLRPNCNGTRPSLEIVASDDGPGIANIAASLERGYSTAGGLGLGLPGVRRIVDEFEIESRIGEGTMVRVVMLRR